MTYYLSLRPNGVIFSAGPGTTAFAKEGQTVREGDIVSFKHSGFLLGSKKPKAPVIYRVRADLNWEDVTKNFEEKIPSAKGVNILPIPHCFFSNGHSSSPNSFAIAKVRKE